MKSWEPIPYWKKVSNTAVTPEYTPSVVTHPTDEYDLSTHTLIVGAGACGLVAALAASENTKDIIIVEADPLPAGSTSLSAGLIPAAGTKLQKAAGINDSPEAFASDIQSKAQHENSEELVACLTNTAAPVIDWLVGTHGLPFTVVDNFDYPGHTHRRMHGLKSRSGKELIDALRTAVENAGVDIICNRRAIALHGDSSAIHGASLLDPNRHTESIACEKLILACNGFGGNRNMVTRYMPDIENALWFGHSGNQGDAVIWGKTLGARLEHLGAYQGHGNVAHPHGILITWAVITEGGIQVNKHGNRFWNESQGYSEAARAVLAQPDGIAYAIFDARIAKVARQFADFKEAEAVGAIKVASTLEELGVKLNLPTSTLEKTVARLPSSGIDSTGRQFDQHNKLKPPYYGVQVTGALFHTQGGLMVDSDARVLHENGKVIKNLFAGGGAACGVSGSQDSGYLSGNGLLSAVVLGFKAGLYT